MENGATNRMSVAALAVLLVVPGFCIAGPQLQQRNKPRTEAAAGSSEVGLPSYFESLFTRYRFENDGTGRKEVIAKIRILNEMGTRQRAEEVFQYHPLSEELRIPYIRVRRKNGTVENIETHVVQRVANGVTPESDLDERRVRIPGLAIGDQVEYDVVTAIRHPLGPGEFVVQHSFQPSGVLDEQLEVDVPINRSVKLKSIPK